MRHEVRGTRLGKKQCAVIYYLFIEHLTYKPQSAVGAASHLEGRASDRPRCIAVSCAGDFCILIADG